MTNKEAIEAIKSNCPTSGYHALREALDVATKSLEKQIPKKPISYCIEFLGNSRIAYDCPACKKCITMIHQKYFDLTKRNSFCDICGQAIDWSEGE